MSSIVTTLFEMEVEMETSSPGRERYNRRVKFEDALDRAVTPLRWYVSSCCDYCFSCICEFAGVDKYKKEREEHYGEPFCSPEHGRAYYNSQERRDW